MVSRDKIDTSGTLEAKVVKIVDKLFSRSQEFIGLSKYKTLALVLWVVRLKFRKDSRVAWDHTEVLVFETSLKTPQTVAVWTWGL